LIKGHTMRAFKLKYKLIAIILAVTFMALFSYLVFVAVKNVERLREEMRENVVTIARVTGTNLIAELAFFDRDAARETLGKLSTISYIKTAIIFDISGERYAEYNAEDAEPSDSISREYGAEYRNGYLEICEKVLFQGKYYGDIFIRASTEPMKTKIWQSIGELLLFIVFLSIVIFLLSWRLQRYISEPILRLTDSFKKVTEDRDYSLKLNKPSEDEIGLLYDGFNEMMEQIHLHQTELKKHKANLETLVNERTRELQEKNVELTRAKEMAENANRLKSEFLANVSHEIRTPMNAILGFTDILLEDEEIPEKKYYLETVQRSGENLLKLINNILDFSKIEADRFEISEVVFSPRKLFYHIEMMFSVKAQEKDLYFKINGLKELPPYLLGDSQKLNQVIINIVSNALKFTHKGGVTIDCQYKDQTLTVNVADTGIGILPEKMAVIFNPFTQADGSTSRQYGGTGLGLSIAQSMTRLMGGGIELTSKVGAGSVFSVSVPMAVGESIENTSGITYKEEDESIKGKIIAIIENDPGDRALLKTVLEKNHYRVVELKNSPAIVEMIVAKNADLVILDIVMEGLGGFEINDLLKKDIRTAHIPVMVYSGSDQIMKSLTSGIVDYIKKPIRQEEVLKRIYINLKMYDQIKNIFLVEDDDVLLNLYCRFLHRHKYNCFAFNSGARAIRKIESGVEPDLIVLDLIMPRVDGFGFLKLLREKCKKPDIPVIIVTAKDLSARELADLKNMTLAIYAKDIDLEKKFITFLDNYFKRKLAIGEQLVRKWIENIEEDEQVKRILMEAIEYLPEKIAELEQAIFLNDLGNIQFLSHSLKGMAMSLRMAEIGDLCKEINVESKRKDCDIERIGRLFIELKELVSSLPERYFRVKPELGARNDLKRDINILVAEDDVINQKLIKIYFKRIGRKCDIAENGKVALAMLKRKKYDILFLDIQMPVMDGLETIKWIRRNEQLKNIYVIALTANALKGDEEKYIEAGCDYYLPKPVKIENLVERIESFIHTHPQ
jgi:signal transduction histidine kinase/DNA-binding response OmpR family regulator